MEKGADVNMGVQVKKLLGAQNKPNVQAVYIGPLVTELCLGLGLDAYLAGEKVEAEMKAFTIRDFFAMNLRSGGVMPHYLVMRMRKKKKEMMKRTKSNNVTPLTFRLR